MMEQMGTPKTEVISWWEQQPDNDMVYHALLRLYEEEDFSKAIELVRGKRESKNNPAWQTAGYTKTLLRLLEKSEDRDGYEKEFRYLMLKLNCREEEYVSRLKNITPAQQWPGVFETLLEGTKWPGDRMRLYHLEGSYSELFTELGRYPSLDSFQIYEEVLRKWNPQRTLQLYTEILKTEMGRASARKQYHFLASHLNKLSSYPNGQEEAKTLAAHWHEYYKNRPAMKDELEKAGYPQEL